MRTILALLTLLLTMLPSWAAASTISGGIFYSTDTTGTNARASRITITPSSAGTNLLAGTLTATNYVTAGTGSILTNFVYNTPSLMSASFGTGASPDTSQNSSLQFSRVQNMSNSGIAGDGSDQAATLLVINTSTTSNEVQNVAIKGVAVSMSTVSSPTHAGDAVGVYALGRQVTGVGTGIGAALYARKEISTAKATGAEVVTANYTTTPNFWRVNGYSDSSGLVISAGGTTNSSVGISINNGLGPQFAVGIGFNGQVNGGLTGAVDQASIYDSSHSQSSIVIDGVHTNAAIAINAGSGKIVVGGTNESGVNLPALLELRSDGSANPLSAIQGVNSADNITGWKIGNNAGSGRSFVAGASDVFVLGSLQGDTGYQISTTNKQWMVGGSANGSVIKVKNAGSAGQLAFFNGTPVDKQGSTTDLKDALVNYTLLTDGGATPLNLDGGALTVGSETITAAAADTTILTGQGYSVTGSGTTTGYKLTGTYNTSGNVSGGLLQLILTNTAANASSRVFSIFGGAAGATALFSVVATDGSVIIAPTSGGLQIGSRVTLNAPAAGRLRLQDSAGVTTNTGFIFGLTVYPAAAKTLASASTIAPLDPSTFVSGTAAIDTITAPPHMSGTGGQITLIPTGIFTTTTGGNIALATTAVVSKALIMTYDSGTAKWYPSY